LRELSIEENIAKVPESEKKVPEAEKTGTEIGRECTVHGSRKKADKSNQNTFLYMEIENKRVNDPNNQRYHCRKINRQKKILSYIKSENIKQRRVHGEKV